MRSAGFLALLLLAFLVIPPASAWYNGTPSNIVDSFGFIDLGKQRTNVSDYHGDNTSFYTDFANRGLTSNTQAKQMHYAGGTFNNGSFSVNLSIASGGEAFIFFASQSPDYLGFAAGNKYFLAPAMGDSPKDIVLYKVSGGTTYTLLGNTFVTMPTGLNTYRVDWFPYNSTETGGSNFEVWVNGSRIKPQVVDWSTDKTYQTPGYFGIGTHYSNPATFQEPQATFRYAPLSIFTADKTECTGTCTVTITDTSTARTTGATSMQRNLTVNGTAQGSGETASNPFTIVLSAPAAGYINYSLVLNVTTPVSMKWDGSAGVNWSTFNLSTQVTYVNVTASGGAAVVPDATFSCTPAGVRNQSRICTNVSSGALIPSKTDFYGWGTNPCIGTNTTTPNPVIFPKNASWCGLCLIALDGAGANANTSCKSQATFTTWPLWGGP